MYGFLSTYTSGYFLHISYTHTQKNTCTYTEPLLSFEQKQQKEEEKKWRLNTPMRRKETEQNFMKIRSGNYNQSRRKEEAWFT